MTGCGFNNSNKRQGFSHRKAYYIVYTIFFICFTLIMMLVFNYLNKTVIWKPDALVQHYPAFVITKDWIISIINYLRGAVDQVPLYSFQLGQGADIITTLNSYDLTDPVSWLAILLCPGHTYRAYCLMILIKMYLAGICFSLLAFLFTEDPVAVFCGCLTYIFSGLFLFLGMLHPNFISGFYFLPLMIYSEELFIRKQRIIPLVMAIFLSVLTNYYVFYMSAILFAGYTVIHVFRRGNVKDSCLLMVRIAGLCILGVLLASVTLLPTIYAYMQCSRSGIVTGYSESFLVFPAVFYKKLIQFAFAPGGISAGQYTVLSLFPISIIAVVFLFIRNTEWKRMRLMFIALMALVCIPVGSRFMNAMGYPRNIWTYGLLLLLAFSVAVMFPVLKNLRTIDIIILIAGTLLYTLYTLGDSSIKCNTETLGIILLWLTVIPITICSIIKRPLLFYKVVISSTLLMVICNLAASYNMPDGLSNYSSQSEIENILAQEAVEMENDNSEFYRVEKQSLLQNLEYQLGYNGTTFFWSIMPENLYEYYEGLNMNTLAQSCNTKGLDGRISLNEIASVKYYACNNQEEYVPYGYLKEKECGNGVTLYRNPFNLPIGYIYSGYIPKEEYDQLSSIGKEQALLQGAVIDTSLDSVHRSSPSDFHQDVLFSIKDFQNASLEEKTINIKEKGGSITLEFEGSSESEMILCLNGLKCIEGSSSTDITVTANKVTKKGRVFTSQNNWPVFLEGITFNLGSRFEQKKYDCTIKFSEKGQFSIDDIKIYSVPWSAYYKNIELLRENSLNNVEISSNKVIGKTDSNYAGILQFSIPNNGGWSAFIDGEEQAMFSSGILYTGVQIMPGKHDIELHYCTPFLKEGMLLSGIGLLVFMVLIWRRYCSIKNNNTYKGDKNGQNSSINSVL